MSIAPPNHTRRTDETTDDWITPRWFLERFGPFDLDPCACVPQPWPCARRHFTVEDSGLLQNWHDWFVFCNPPYGRKAAAWLERMKAHGNGIALVFARTETRMFFRHVWLGASAVLLVEGRIQFCYPDGTEPKKKNNSGGPSAVIAYGLEAQRRLLANKDVGVYLSDWQL